MSVVDSPHTPQNAAPRSTCELHRGHLSGGVWTLGAGGAAEAIAPPHMRQKRIPAGFSALHCGHRAFETAEVLGAAGALAVLGAAGAATCANGPGAGAGAAAVGCAGGGAPISLSFWPQSRQNSAVGGFWRPQLLQFITVGFHYQRAVRVKE
jgi:hypothetical protein